MRQQGSDSQSACVACCCSVGGRSKRVLLPLPAAHPRRHAPQQALVESARRHVPSQTTKLRQNVPVSDAHVCARPKPDSAGNCAAMRDEEDPAEPNVLMAAIFAVPVNSVGLYTNACGARGMNVRSCAVIDWHGGEFCGARQQGRVVHQGLRRERRDV